MSNNLEDILLAHDRKVVAAGKTYDGQVSSVIREETMQAITALMENEKTPEGVSPPDKVLYLNTTIDGVLNQYDIRHPKPSISRNTARKMLKRDLTALQDAEIEYVLGGVDVALEAYTGSGIITGYTEYLKSVLRQRYQERRSNG